MSWRDSIKEDMVNWSAHGLYRELTGPLDPSVVDFSSNDYLGLTQHPALQDVARQLTEARRAGAGASRLVGGDLAVHHALESRIAQFKGTEAALLFPSGYQANVGSIACLADKSDVIYSDALNHASIIDGCRLSRATVKVFAHGDTEALETRLQEDAAARRKLVITDSIFSMDGDAANLPKLHALAIQYDALLMVDEAHATGVYGPQGEGWVKQSGAKADLQLVTFGKALGGFGAAICGPRDLIEYLQNRCRTFVFTTALPPLVCTAAIEAIELCCSAEGMILRSKLWDNVAYFSEQAQAAGLATRPLPSPIQPMVIGEPERAVAISHALLDKGFFVQAIRPPTVPHGTSRLRISLSARHSHEQIHTLIAALCSSGIHAA